MRDRPVAETSTWSHATLTTDIHSTGGIRNRNPCNRATEGLRLRPRGHWDRRVEVQLHDFLSSVVDERVSVRGLFGPLRRSSQYPLNSRRRRFAEETNILVLKGIHHRFLRRQTWYCDWTKLVGKITKLRTYKDRKLKAATFWLAFWRYCSVCRMSRLQASASTPAVIKTLIFYLANPVRL